MRNGSTWSQQAYVKASNTGTADTFGNALALSGDTLVVGAGLEDSSATGVNGNQASNSTMNSGAAYVFTRSGATWAQQAYLKASNPGASDSFGGRAIQVSGDSLVIGATGEDSDATGIGGNQANDNASAAGAAYAFDLDLDAWDDLGFGRAGVNGIPGLAGSGSLVAGSPGSLSLTHAKPSALCTLHVSLSSTPVPFKGGTLLAFPTVLNVPLVTLPDGTLVLPFLWPSGLPPGTMLWFQYSISDLAAVKKVSLSNALKATTP